MGGICYVIRHKHAFYQSWKSRSLDLGENTSQETLKKVLEGIEGRELYVEYGLVHVGEEEKAYK